MVGVEQMNATIIKLSDRREALKRRISARKRARKGHADLDVKLLAATMRQLRAERRWERQQGKVT